MRKDRDLASHVAVVTGSMQGIGQATAVALAHASTDVIGVALVARARDRCAGGSPLALAGASSGRRVGR